jgi:hypothetical protein
MVPYKNFYRDNHLESERKFDDHVAGYGPDTPHFSSNLYSLAGELAVGLQVNRRHTLQ